MLEVDIKPVKNVLFIYLEGSLNRNNTYKLKEVINVLKKVKINNLIFNLKMLDNIDAYGMYDIIYILNLCHNNKSKYAILSDKKMGKYLDTTLKLKTIYS